MMEKITKSVELDYGHTLPNHYGFCSQIHGHRGRVEATVEGALNVEVGSSSQGMVLDFKFLKALLMEQVHDKLDHGFAVWKYDLVDLKFIQERNTKYLVTDLPPTAEYLAQWAYEALEPKIPEGLKLINLRWYETPNSWVDYNKNYEAAGKRRI